MKKEKITKITICVVIIVATLVIAFATNKRPEKTMNNAGTVAASQTVQTGSVSSGKTNATPFPQIERGEEYYANAQSFISTGDTENAIRALRSIPSSSKYFSDAQNAIGPLENEYRLSILDRARAAYDSDGWAAACSVLWDGSDLLPGDYEFLSAIEMYEACEPISYLKLDRRSESGGLWNSSAEVYIKTGEERDALGEIHSGEYVDFWIHCMTSRCQMTKYNYREHNRFRGTVVLPRNCDGKIIFTVYGDEREIYTTGEITRKDSCAFDIDVSAFLEVQCVVQVVDFGLENTVDVYLFNPEVYSQPSFA